MENPTRVQNQQLGSQNLQRQIAKIESEDVHLWSITLLLGLAVAAGFAALVVPNVVWHHSVLVYADTRYLPHLLFAFIALILIFNVYIFDQRRKLNWTREELLQQLVRGDVAERLSLIDPLTEVYNRRDMEEALVKEASRANRVRAALSLIMIDADDFKQVNTRLGHQQGDLILVEIAKLLKSTFRGSDTIVRYGGDEFLIILPDTDEQQGRLAIGRLAKGGGRLEHGRQGPRLPHEPELRSGWLAAGHGHWAGGRDGRPADVLEQVCEGQPCLTAPFGGRSRSSRIRIRFWSSTATTDAGGVFPAGGRGQGNRRKRPEREVREETGLAVTLPVPNCVR